MGLLEAGRRRFSRGKGILRIPLYDPDFPAIVMWSEKAGCTSAAKWFFWHIGRLEEALAYNHWVHRFRSEVFTQSDDYLDRCLAAMKAGMPIIKFTRNPYDRAYSGFMGLCRSRVLENPNHWTTKARAAVIRHLFGKHTPIDQAFSFADYVDWLVVQKEADLDLHLAPQKRTLETSYKVTPLQLEMEGGPFAHAEAMFGLRSSAEELKLFSSRHHHNRMTLDEEAQRGALSVPRSVTVLRPESPDISNTVIAKQLGDKLGPYFAADFEAYGYSQ